MREAAAVTRPFSPQASGNKVSRQSVLCGSQNIVLNGKVGGGEGGGCGIAHPRPGTSFRPAARPSRGVPVTTAAAPALRCCPLTTAVGRRYRRSTRYRSSTFEQIVMFLSVGQRLSVCA